MPRIPEPVTQGNSPVLSTLKELSKHPLLDGELVSVDADSTTSITVQHRLKRRPRGYILASKNANVDVWLNKTNSKPESQLVFTISSSTAGLELTFWIF